MANDALDDRGLAANYPLQPQWEVTPVEVRDGLAAGTVSLIDVREAEEYATTHIEGSVLIPMSAIASRLGEVEDLAEKGTLVVHCHHGGRSLQVATWLREQGVVAKSMAGGIDVWSRGIDASVPRY